MFQKSVGKTPTHLDPVHWSAKITEGRNALWENKLDKAQREFAHVIKKLSELSPSQLNNELREKLLEAQLGNWATLYLNNKAQPEDYLTLTSGNDPGKKNWLFLAKVFNIRQDIHSVALNVYVKVIQAQPTEKNVNSVLRLLESAPFNEHSLRLLEETVRHVTDKTELALKLMKWQIRAQKYQTAQQTAHNILSSGPNREARRGLGYLYEIQGDWNNASSFFALSEEWLRAAVCSNHAGRATEAVQFLDKVPTAQREVNWQYQYGWANFQLGFYHKTIQCWETLLKQVPQFDEQIWDDLNRVKEQFIYLQTQDGRVPEITHGNDLPVEIFQEIYFRRAVKAFFWERNTIQAQNYLARINKSAISPLIPVIQLLTQPSGSSSVAASVSTEIKVLARWFYALQMSEKRPPMALRLLREDQAIVKKFIPQEAIELAIGLVALLTDEVAKGLEILKAWEMTIPPHTPFYGAGVSTLTALKIKNGEILPTINSHHPEWARKQSSWPNIQAILLAKAQNWESLLGLLKENQIDRSIEGKLLIYGMHKSLVDNQWAIASQFLTSLTSGNPAYIRYKPVSDQLYCFGLNQLWQDKQYTTIEAILDQRVSSDLDSADTHHARAILFTRWALDPPINHTLDSHTAWTFALGEWAVVLSDGRYWQGWLDNRSKYYEPPKDILDDLRREKIPDLIVSHLQALDSTTESHNYQYTYLSALFSHELDTMYGIRHVQAQATHQRIDLPPGIKKWWSPILVKAHAPDDGLQFLELLIDFSLLQDESDNILLAFSTFREASLWARSGNYEKALDEFQKHTSRSDPKAQILYQNEKMKTLVAFSQHLMKRQLWDQAISYAQQVLDFNPQYPGALSAFFDAHAGWAQTQLQQDKFLEVVQKLREIRQKHKYHSSNVDELFLQASASQAFQALDDEKLTVAKKILDEAYEINKEHPLIREGLAIYYSKIARDYEKKTIFSTASLNALLAYEFSKTTDAANFVVALHIRCAFKTAEMHRFTEAINFLDKVKNLPFDENEFMLNKIYSAIYTDYGAVVYNSGNTWEGRRLARLAYELDPSNQVARKNMML